MKIESIGLFEIDMSEIKRNSKKIKESLQRLIELIEIRKKGWRLPNGRYKK